MHKVLPYRAVAVISEPVDIDIRPLTQADEITAYQGGVWSVGRTWVLDRVTDEVTSYQGGTWIADRSWLLDDSTDSVSSFQGGIWNVNALQSGVWSVAVNNFPATQPISGTVTALQGTSPWTIAGTVNQGASALPGNAWYTRITDGTTTVGISNFSLQVESTNGAGAAAVNIQDGGNSITVDGTVAATQSGTWNINNIGGTISLPTGASTAANQATQLTSLQLLDDVPAGMNAAFNKGNPIMAQLDDTSTVAATEDNVSVLRLTAQRALHTNLRNNSGTEVGTASAPLRTDPTGTTTQPVSGTVTANQGGAPWSNNVTQVGGASLTLGQKAMAASIPVVLASDQSALPVNTTPGTAVIATYSTAVVGLVIAASATDVFTITGSATKTIKIRRIIVSATRTSDAKTDIVLVKRSTANTGGTSTTPTVAPHDSTNAAATAVVRAYTVNPTTGTSVGMLRAQKQYIPVASSSVLEELIEWDFGDLASQPIVLRGTSEVLSINMNGQTITGPSFDISIQFTEE